ncbi:hypothetical protein ABPG73_006434 [Tetrahymena malaccensis]
MEKQNISYRGQGEIEPTQNQVGLNQLSQQIACTEYFQNQENSSKIQNKLVDINIIAVQEQTVLKKVKSQIVRRTIAQDKIIQNGMYQIINQREDQHAIISNQNQENDNYIQHVSSKNKKIVLQDKSNLLKNFSQKQGQTKQEQTIIQQIPINQINPQQLKYSKQKKDNNSTKNEDDLNQISQEISIPKQSQNQECSPKIQNKLEDTNITTTSEQTLLKKVKNQIIRKSVGFNKIVQNNANYYVFNQKKNQHAIVSYKNQDNQNCIQHIYFVQQVKSSFHSFLSGEQGQIKQEHATIKQVPNNQINHLQINQQKTDQNQQKAEKENSQKQTLKHELITYENHNYQDNSERKILQQDSKFSQNGLCLKKAENKQKQTTIQKIANSQINLRKLKYLDEKNQNLEKENISYKNHYPELKIIFDEIEDYSFDDYEKLFDEKLFGTYFIKKVWDYEIFDRVNETKRRIILFMQDYLFKLNRRFDSWILIG